MRGGKGVNPQLGDAAARRKCGRDYNSGTDGGAGQGFNNRGAGDDGLAEHAGGDDVRRHGDT